jgi:hypothetical protein
MEFINIHNEQVEISSKDHCYKLRLNDDRMLIRRDSDILEMVLQDAPDYLVKVHFCIGNQRMMTFVKDEFINKQNLFPQGIPISLATFLYSDLEFEYDGEYIDANLTTVMVDEYIEEIEISEEEDEFFDGSDYIYGRSVHRKMVPTGYQVSKVIKGADVTLPKVQFGVIKSDKPKTDQYDLPIWESFTIKPSEDEVYIQRLITKYNLKMKDGSDVSNALKSGKPLEAKLQNIIRFSGGMAGKAFVFE